MQSGDGSQQSKEYIRRWISNPASSESEVEPGDGVDGAQLYPSRFHEKITSPRPGRKLFQENTQRTSNDSRTGTIEKGGGEGAAYPGRKSHSNIPNYRQSSMNFSGQSYKRSIQDNRAQSMTKAWKPGDLVTLLVDNTPFVVDPNLIIAHPNTMLGRMFIGGNDYTRRNDRGEFEVANGISANVFGAVLEFYKGEKISCPPDVSISELREACDYLLVPFDVNTVRCGNLRMLLHEVSNEGARQKFVIYLDELIYPVMVVSAQRGNRECRVINLLDEDVVVWDEQYPPSMGEDSCLTIQSTAMNRFLRYIENRNVAKLVMKERGLKKIRLGIEGYPTSMEKKRKGSDGRIEVVYNYVQRPFIHMSWEQEEAKSRHVDFQCFRSKSGTNLSEANADPTLLDGRGPVMSESPSLNDASISPL